MRKLFDHDSCSPLTDGGHAACEGGESGPGDGGTPPAGTPPATGGTPPPSDPGPPDAAAAAKAAAEAKAAAKAQAEKEAAAKAKAEAEQAAKDKQRTDAKNKAESNPDDVNAQIEAMRAEMQAMREGYDAKLSAAEEQLGKQRAAMTAEVLGGLRVKEKYRGYAPEADPMTPEGRATLEKWAQENPELCEAPTTAAPGSLTVDQVLGKGWEKNDLISPAAMQKSFGSI